MFEENRNLIDEAKIKGLIADGNEMADLLRRNIVQAVQVDEGRYRIQFDPNVHEMADNADDFVAKKRPEDMPEDYLKNLAAQNPVKCGDIAGAQRVLEQRKRT